MQKIKENEINEPKMDCYMPIDNPTANKMYQLIKKHEKEILNMVAFTIPTVELRKHMDTIRGHLKHVSCENCEHLGKNSHKLRTVNVFVKDDNLSEKYGIPCETEKEPIKVVKVLTERVVDRLFMACEGCRALRLKQIATGFIKNRRFKQV